MTLRRWTALLAIALLLAVGWTWLARGARERAQAAPSVESAVAIPDQDAELAAPVLPVASELAPELRTSIATSQDSSGEPAAPALAPGEGRVRIHVTARETGKDQAGIDIDLRAEGQHENWMPFRNKPSRGRAGDSLVTDERGLAEFIVPGDTPLWLAATFPLPGGWFTQELPPLTAGETRVQEIAVPTELDVRSRGRVIDAASSQPIADASVALVDTGPTVHTDANGLFELVTASWRDDVARVHKAGYARNLLDLGPECEGTTEPCPVPLLASASLELRVSDARGAAAPGLRVRVKSPWAGQGGTGERFVALDKEQWTASTDDSGVCTLELPPAEELTLELLDALGTTPMGKESLRLEPGEHRVLAMTVADGSAVTGQVVDVEGRALPAIDVFLLPEDARFRFARYDERALQDGRAFRTESDAEGRFHFERVPPGTWCVGPGWKPLKDRKGGPAGLPIEVRVVEGEPVAPVTLTVWMGRCIRGRIVGPDGAPFLPAAPAECMVRATSATYSLHAYLFDDSFELGPLMPGSYRVTAEDATGFADSEEVIVRDGEENVLLRLREGGTIAGVVLDAEGNGVKGLAVAGTGSGRTSWAGTDDAGAFAFDPLVPGPCDLFASTEDGAASLHVTVERGVERSGIVLRLEAVAHPIVRVKGGTRDLRCTVRVDGRWAGMHGLADAAETRITAPPGALELHLFRRTQGEPVLLATRTLLVLAGEEPVVEFAIEPGAAAR